MRRASRTALGAALVVLSGGIDTVSDSPYGLVGPKAMPREVVKRLHDAFKGGV